MKPSQKMLIITLIALCMLSFFSVAEAATLNLPPALETVMDESFMGDTSLDEVVIPEGCISIGTRAFANCKIKTITLPSTLAYIAPTAFNGNSGMKVYAPIGSYAYDWAVENGFIVGINGVENLQAFVDGKTVILSWPSANGVDGYRISEIISGNSNVLATTSNETYYELNNVSTGTHTYAVETIKSINGSTAYGTSKQIKVSVSKAIVTSITLNRFYIDAEINETATLSATVEPSYADNKAVTWSSDNTNVATVTTTGKITAKSSGTATITATAKDGSGVSASCVVNVSVEAPYLTVTHPTIGDVLNAGEIEMFNGAAQQTWTVDSNYATQIEKVGDWFTIDHTSFAAGSNTLILNMSDGVPAGTKRTGKVKFFINESLFVTVNICQDGGSAETVVVDPTITVHHPVLGDIFEAGTFEMWNGSAVQTWTVTANCNWTITKSGTWFTVDKTSGSAGTSTIKLAISDGAEAGETRNGSVTFKANGNTYKTVNFKQVGPAKALTVTHESLGDIIAASPIEMHNGAAHQTWTVTSNADWTLSKTGTWYSVSKTSGSAGTETVVLTFPDGADPGETRSGTLKFYFGSSLYATIRITQDGGADTEPTASISVVHPWIGDVIAAGSVNLTNSSGQSSKWTVFANYDWTISTTGSWFTVSPTSGSANTKTTVTVTTTSYAPSSYNSGTIKFKKGSSTKATIYLYQGEGYDSSDNDDSFTVNHPSLGNVLDQDTIYMFNGIGYQTWSVVSNVDWSLTKSGSWFTVSPTSGTAKTATDVKLTFTSGVAAGESREGYVKFSYYINGVKKTSTVYIAQDGGSADPTPSTSLAASHALLGDVFEASPIEMHNGTGTEQNWTITSNKSWSIVKSGSWFSVSPTSGSANTSSNKSTNVKISITDYARPGTKNSGTITFYVDGSKYKTVNIFQDGGESTDPSMTVGSPDFGNVLSLNTITLGNTKKSYTWALQANTSWSATKSGSWFTISPTSGSASANATTSFVVTVNSLPTSADLTGSITFKLDGTTYKTIHLKIPYAGTITPTDNVLPAPLNLNASVTSKTSAKLTWSSVSGASGYNVYRSTNATTGYSKLNSSLVTSPYIDSTLTAGVNYYYTVEAVNSNGVVGSRSIPFGPVSYNAACALTIHELSWNVPAAGQSKSFAITKHGSNDFTVSIKQYNSEGDLCTGVTDSNNHKLAKWLTSSKSGTTVTLTAAKNYAAAGKTAVVTIKCGCGATHTITVNQLSGETAPKSVSMTLDGYNGFTESSTVKDKATASHLDYVLIPGDTITVSASGGNYARRLTVRILNANGETVLDKSSTTTGATGLSKSYSYSIPDGATGIYTINVFASNSTTAGDDAQWINASAKIRVKDGTISHTSTNYPYEKLDFSDQIWSILTNDWKLSPVHAAAIMGNIDAESGYCPYNSQKYSGADDRTKYNFATNDGIGFGLCQWTSSGRKVGLLNYANGSEDLVWDFDTQMGYLKSELNMTTLQSYSSLYEATEWFDIWFERPDQGSANSWPGTRYAKALHAYKKYVGSAYSEPALNFSVKQNGTNVISGYKLPDNLAISSTATLAVSSNYYWRLSQESSTVSDWLSITCPKLYYPNQTVNCECGYAGNTTLTLKVNKIPATGQSYSTTLVFEIYQNSHVTKKVPITLTYAGASNDPADISSRRTAAVNRAYEWVNYKWEVPSGTTLHLRNGDLPAGTKVYGVPYSLHSGTWCMYSAPKKGTPATSYYPYINSSFYNSYSGHINRQYNTSYAGEALVGGEPKYGAECLQLVWDCWVCAGFDVYRDNFSLGSNGVSAVDWSNVKPGDLIRLKKSVQTGDYTHYMLIVAVNGTKVTVIEQTAGASRVKSGDYYQVGTRCRTVDIDDANEYGKYSMRNAYDPYTWSGFNNK